MTAQDKILHVASKLGLSSLQNMQGSTGAVYDVDIDFQNTLFSNSARHQNPGITNVNENRFEVNEALLIENVAFYVFDTATNTVENYQTIYGSSNVILFDLKIGNKTVLKNTPIFAAGMPYTFANVGSNLFTALPDAAFSQVIPRHQVFMEGAGILIPPQVEWSIEYRMFSFVTGAQTTFQANKAIGAYLFGTKVLLNFNTSI